MFLLSLCVLKTTSKGGQKGDTNRGLGQLSKARKMFGVALAKKWVFDNPFKTEAGKQLIQVDVGMEMQQLAKIFGPH